jgi:hypothetical protein
MTEEFEGFAQIDAALGARTLDSRLGQLRLENIGPELVRLATARVVSWSWTTQPHGGGEREEPFWRQRYGLGPRVKEVPGRAPVSPQGSSDAHKKSGKNKTFREFGRDADGQLAVSWLVAEDSNSAWAWHLNEIDGRSAEVWLADWESIEINRSGTHIHSVRRRSWAEGHLVASARYADDRGGGPPWQAELFSYKNGELDAIWAWGESSPPESRETRVRYWTVEEKGKTARRRPWSSDASTRLSDDQLNELTAEYLRLCAAEVPVVVESAWRRISGVAVGASSEAPTDSAVCLLALPSGPWGLPAIPRLKVLTVADRKEAHDRRRNYKPLDFYLKAAGNLDNALDRRAFGPALDQLVAMDQQISSELHRRRNDKDISDLGTALIERLQTVQWSSILPTTTDFTVGWIDDEGPIKARRSQVERAFGPRRFAILLQEETVIAAARQPGPAPMSLSHAEQALIETINAREASGSVSVGTLWTAFAQFARVPVAGCDPAADGDAVLVAWDTERPDINLSFRRQLHPDSPDGSPTELYAVTLTVTLQIGPELVKILSGSTWLNPATANLTHAGKAIELVQTAWKLEPNAYETQASYI